MADRANTLLVLAADRITLSNERVNMAGWCWDGQRLSHPTGKALRFSAEITAELDAAVASIAPVRYETKRGGEIAANEHGWEYAGLEQDAHPVYTRTVRGPGAESARVRFGKADLR